MAREEGQNKGQYRYIYIYIILKMDEGDHEPRYANVPEVAKCK